MSRLSDASELDLARRCFEQGDHTAAKSHLANCLHESRHRAEACAILGRVFQLEGSFAKSIVCFEKAIAAGNHSIDVHYGLCESLFEAGQYDHAQEKLEALVADHPTHRGLHELLGKLLVETHQLTEAVQALERAVRFLPDSAELHYLLGLALLRMTRFAEAEISLNRSIELDPDTTPQTHLLLGKSLLAQGYAIRAIDAFKHSARIYPLAELYYPMAKAYQLVQKYDIALKIFDKALERPINRSIRHHILFHQADILFEQGEQADRQGRQHYLYGGVLQKLERAIELVPGFAAARHLSALARLKMGDEDETILQLKKLLETGQEDLTNQVDDRASNMETLTRRYLQLTHLGYALSLKGHHNAARSALTAALQDPYVQRERVVRCRILRRLALVLLDAGEVAEAAETWRQLLPLDPDGHYGAAEALSVIRQAETGEGGS